MPAAFVATMYSEGDNVYSADLVKIVALKNNNYIREIKPTRKCPSHMIIIKVCVDYQTKDLVSLASQRVVRGYSDCPDGMGRGVAELLYPI